MPRSRIPWGLLAGLVAAAGLVLVVIQVVRGGGAVPDGPVPVVWDKESCAHCRMAVGQPGYAAQLITKAGEVATFDDPGCLLRYLEERHPEVHRLWFHHPSQDRWLGVAEVAFEVGATTPMGWGLVAAERGPGTIDLAAARGYIATRDAGPGTGAVR